VSNLQLGTWVVLGDKCIRGDRRTLKLPPNVLRFRKTVGIPQFNYIDLANLDRLMKLLSGGLETCPKEVWSLVPEYP